jgi:hypothetical protein
MTEKMDFALRERNHDAAFTETGQNRLIDIPGNGGKSFD